LSLVLESVTKRVRGEPHIADVTLTLEPASLNVLLGPTLSGKTSLMRLMAGLDRPSEGRILVDGRDVTGVPVLKRSVAMVYQQFINYPNLTVYENIASPLRAAKRPKTVIDAKVREAANLMRLSPLLDRLPEELSGGQQQRTALARAIAKGADVLLLDEPLANLDYKLREELREELPRIFADSGAILVYATTEPSEALLLGGKTATLHEGRVTQFGSTVAVFRRPNSLITARIFADPPLNTAAAHKQGDRFHLGKDRTLPATGRFAALADGTYTLGFRPNHLRLNRPTAEALEMTGTVAITEITGSESFVHVDVGIDRWIALEHGIHDLTIDQPVTVYLDPDRFYVFDAAGGLAMTAASIPEP